MKTLIIAAALALAPVAASADSMAAMPSAPAKDMSGAWKIDGAFGDAIKYTLTCTLKQDGMKLSGPCSNSLGGDPVSATGSVDGAKVVLSYDTTYQGSPVHLDYKGDTQADGTLKGVIETGMAEGTFTGAKQ
jgi:hypothetical protein